MIFTDNMRTDIEKKIFKDRVSTLYATIWSSAVPTLFNSALYVFIQFSQNNKSQLFYWFVTLWLIYVGRIIVYKLYKRTNPGLNEQGQWLNFCRLGILLTGITFGSIGVIFFSVQDVPHQFFAILLLAGMAGGGLTVLVADLFSFTVYVCALLIPSIIVSAGFGDRLHIAASILMSVYLLVIIRASFRLNGLVISTLKLRYENIALVGNLEQEKNRLSNRLGRILNDSSNELFVLDAETLLCLQVNKGAVQHLGYSPNEFTKMTLLDILDGIDRNSFDQLVKPLRLGTRDTIIHRSMQKRKDGTTYPVEIRLQFFPQGDPPIFVVTALDVSERYESERKLIYQANYDQLTKLPNRYFMVSYIDKAFARSRRKKTKVSLLFMDLDNFKDINDTLGHALGDKLLKMVAERIQQVLRETDMAARLGGDEFLVMLEGLEEQEQAEAVALKLGGCFEKPFLLDEQEIYTSCSIGISTYPDDGNSVDQLMQYADTAMYYAKRDGRSNYRFFSQELRIRIDEQLAVVNQLRQALKNNEFYLCYQPMINIISDRIVGAEALLRWDNPELGRVSPNVFIPIAEKYGLIEDIGLWVLETACHEAAGWRKISSEELNIAVNVSPRQFRSNNFLQMVDYVLYNSGLQSSLLELEITENLLLQDTWEPLEILHSLRERGISLSLDDFGTGYSSLSYLKRFPLQTLKIDRCFISDLLDDYPNRSLVAAIIAMARSLNLNLIAEGVENQRQLDFLQDRGVEIVQGFLFSPPVSVEKFRVLISEDERAKRSLLMSK